ncbi:hypothetical protein PYJP_07220 [Pyrofollis japonicus]|uniref:type II toxin-antitoxin system VapC family toxin n=1 Tax=Pyrofollis japonicus TaxID=3060460 RepID=UPI00295BC511|nr:PIN domain-containing protein [Pyrofollis japonicus]BEP17370.1 hypothetical protein PYJP_07220 [Pyrofollis japonicus]
MSLVYVDTSVVVAALDPLDPRRDGARRALQRPVGKIVSELVSAELASVLSRQRGVLEEVRRRLGVDESVAFVAVLLYILKRFGLRYVPVKKFSRTLLGRFYGPIAYSILLSEKLRLRTLDLLHLAYIKALREQGIPVDTLLTADTDFKENEERIRNVLGITVELIK